MSRLETLEYIDDTILIESIYQEEFGITKTAGLFDQLNLGSLSESIKQFVSSNVKEDAPGGYVGSVLSIMAPAILFRVNPVLGGLATVASAVGFDLQSVIGKILDLIKNKLGKGEVMTEADVNQIGKDVISSETGIEATAENMLEPLRKYSISRRNISLSSGLLDNIPSTPWLVGSGNSTLSKIFENLFSLPSGGKNKIIWLIGGFIIWTIKTLLLGAGLLAGGQFVYKLIKGDKKEELKEVNKPADQTTESSEQSQPVENKPEPIQEPEIKPEVKKIKEDRDIVEKLKEVSKSKEMWVVPIIGTIEGTLMAWTMDLYPEFTNINILKNKLINSHSFREVVNMLKDPSKMSSKYLIMPDRFSTRKDVVDLFIKDIK